MMTGVYPVYNNKFKVGDAKESATMVADAESFTVSVTNGVETWTPFDSEGWQRALMTAKAVTIAVTAKRNIGDVGNDFVANKAFVNGKEAEGYFAWEFPDGTEICWENAIYNVTNVGSGDSTGVAALEFEIISNGKPQITEVTE